jgi:hypothetical protein
MRKRVWWLVVLLTVVGPAAGASLAVASSSPTVAVPRVLGTEISSAYARLHRAGLRVSIRNGFEFDLLYKGRVIYPRLVVRMTPKPGRAVRKGSVVTLSVRCKCQTGHTREPAHKPLYQIPPLAGRPAIAAYTWVRPKVLGFVAHLGSLHAGNAPTLFGNYFATRQAPGAYTSLRYSTGGARTPFSIWARQLHGG